MGIINYIEDLRFSIPDEWVSSLGNFLKNDGLYALSSNELYSSLCKKYCSIFQRKYALAYNNGTAAIHAALLGLNLNPGDHVALPVYGYPAALHACLLRGLNPIPIDIEKDTLNISPNALREALKAYPIKAIIVINMWGIPAYYNELTKISKKFNIPTIEDSSRSIFAKRDQISSVQTFGDISCLSLNIHKALGVGEGGILLTNDEKIYDRAAILSHVIHANIISSEYSKYIGCFFGLKGKMSPTMAFLALKALECADQRKIMCTINYQKVKSIFLELAEIELLDDYGMIRGCWSGFPIIKSRSELSGINIHDPDLFFIKPEYSSNFMWKNEVLSDFMTLLPAISDLKKRFLCQNPHDLWPVAEIVSRNLFIIEGICSYHKDASIVINLIKDLIYH